LPNINNGLNNNLGGLGGLGGLGLGSGVGSNNLGMGRYKF